MVAGAQHEFFCKILNLQKVQLLEVDKNLASMH